MLAESRTRRSKLWRIATVFAAGGALALAGCVDNSDSSSPAPESSAASAAKVEEIANTLPEDIKSSGTLVVGTDPSYPPNEFKDPSGKVIGFDVELMDAVAATLGLTPEYRPSAFDKIIPSIQGGTYDVGMSSFTDSKEREEQVDFVTYFEAGSAWAQKAGAGINPDDACGRRVAVQTATVQDTQEMPRRSEKCLAEGKPAINVVKFDDQTAATTAVVLGQADAMSADSPVTAWAIKQNEGKLEEAGEIFDSAPYGWAVQKGSPLAESLKQALEHLMETGAYEQVAKNWGAEQGMIDKPVINGAVS